MYYLSLMCFLLFAFSTAQAKTVLITGANRGLGLEFARQYQAKGYDVIGTARSPEKASSLKALGVRVEELDVADGESVAALAKKLGHIPIDIVINNAGILIGRGERIETLDIDDLTKSFAVNATGAVRVTKALLPNLRAGKDKKLINITSVLGSIGQNNGGMYAYRASKAALNQLTKTISIDLEKEGFICIALHPGWVSTDMGGLFATYTPEQSVTSMIGVIDKLDERSTGRFLDLHGKEIPW